MHKQTIVFGLKPVDTMDNAESSKCRGFNLSQRWAEMKSSLQLPLMFLWVVKAYSLHIEDLSVTLVQYISKRYSSHWLQSTAGHSLIYTPRFAVSGADSLNKAITNTHKMECDAITFQSLHFCCPQGYTWTKDFRNLPYGKLFWKPQFLQHNTLHKFREKQLFGKMSALVWTGHQSTESLEYSVCHYFFCLILHCTDKTNRSFQKNI